MNGNLLERIGDRAIGTESTAKPLIAPKLYTSLNSDTTAEDGTIEAEQQQTLTVNSLLKNRPETSPEDTNKISATNLQTELPIPSRDQDSRQSDKPTQISTDIRPQSSDNKQNVLSDSTPQSPNLNVESHEIKSLPARYSKQPLPARTMQHKLRSVHKEHKVPDQNVVNVHIGRIEVRAQTPAPVIQPNKRNSVAAPLSLNAYLNGRSRRR